MRLLFLIRQRVEFQEIALNFTISSTLLIYVKHILIAPSLVGCIESAFVGFVDDIS